VGTICEVSDPADARLADYVDLTDTALRRRLEPACGLFIAEGDKVIRRAVRAGYPIRSLLLSRRWLPQLLDLLDGWSGPVFVAEEDVLEALTGFSVHRGALASMERLPLPTPAQLLASARRIVLLEGLVDPTNVGLVTRSAAAFGMDGMLLDSRCADPLFRRAVKTSMGTVFSLPYTRFSAWPEGIDEVRSAGFTVLALTPAAGSIALDELPPDGLDRCALLLGTEGAGLSRGALAAADLAVRIPMAQGIDSLNIAAAAAVAMWELSRLGGPGRRATR